MRVSIISSTLLICLSSFIFQVESKAQNTLRALELALRENDNTCEGCTTYTIETDTGSSSQALQEGKIWQFTSMAFELKAITNAVSSQIDKFDYPPKGNSNVHQSLPMPASATYKSTNNAAVDNAAELTLTVNVAAHESYMWKISKVTVYNKVSKHITLCPDDNDKPVKCSVQEDTIIAFRLPHKPGDCSATATDAPLPSSNNNNNDNNDKGSGNGNNGGNNPPVISTTAAPSNATKNGTQTGGGGKADATTEGGAAFCSLTLLAAYFAAASWMLV